MPNTVVKLINAESTWLEAAWEDRKLLIKKERGHTEMCVLFRCVCTGGRTAEREIPVRERRNDYGSRLLHKRGIFCN